jgi:hypothetical protein
MSGLTEAVTWQSMRFVELKSQTNLDMQTLHRARDRLVERTALINQLRAILLERDWSRQDRSWRTPSFLGCLPAPLSARSHRSAAARSPPVAALPDEPPYGRNFSKSGRRRYRQMRKAASIRSRATGPMCMG